MMPTLLLTDALIWLLVFGVLAYVRSVLKTRFPALPGVWCFNRKLPAPVWWCCCWRWSSPCWTVFIFV